MNEVYLRAVRELAAAKERVRDLEGFVRMYPILMGEAFSMPTGDAEPAPAAALQAVRAVVNPQLSRPEVSLNDPDLSISEAAAKVLRHTMRPMKARELAETMLRWGYPYKGTPSELRASVGGILSREVREQNTFSKPAVGTFGLREWGGAHDVDDSEEGQTEYTFESGPDATQSLLLDEITVATDDAEGEDMR